MFLVSLSVAKTAANVSTQARLAQSVEHETLNLRVVGSSPTLGATLFHFFITSSSWVEPPTRRHGLVG